MAVLGDLKEGFGAGDTIGSRTHWKASLFNNHRKDSQNRNVNPLNEN